MMGWAKASARWLSVVVTVLTAAPAWAQDSGKAEREWLAQPDAPLPVAGKAEEPSPWRLGGIVLLVGAVGAAAVYAKRRQRTKAGIPDVPDLSVVGAAKVASKGQVVLVSVSGRLLLLGVTDTSVRMLDWVTPKPESDAPPAKDANPFDGILDGILTDELEDEPKPVTQTALRDRPLPKREPSVLPASSAAVDLALQTRDEATTSPQARKAARTHTPSTGDRKRRKNGAPGVEGQARGLTRRKDPRA